MKEWLIYQIAENENKFFILSFFIAISSIITIGTSQIILGIVFLIIFFISLFIIDKCIKYTKKSETKHPQ